MYAKRFFFPNVQMVGIEEDTLKWTVAREVLTCYEAHGVPLPPGVSINLGLVLR